VGQSFWRYLVVMRIYEGRILAALASRSMSIRGVCQKGYYKENDLHGSY